MLSVLADGRFSVLHLGHIAYLSECKALPDAHLTVRVSPETKCFTILGQSTAAAVVAALRCVDAVVADSRTLAQVVRDLRPDVLCKGEDWRGRLPADVVAACRSVGCEVRYIDAEPRMSASALVREWARRDAEAGLEELERHATGQVDTQPEPERWAAGGDWAARYAPEREETHAGIIAGLVGAGAGRVLDVGCGDGALVEALHRRGVRVWGIDPATRGGNVEHERATYDLVISREVLEHLSVRQAMAHVRELVRVCAGRVYITTRFHSTRTAIGCEAETPSADQTHVTCFPQAWLRSVLVAWGCVRDRAWETALDWQHKGRVLVYRKRED
jgi:glycerol-3-phosphate cytidylyltransferase-like family protein